MFNQEYRPIERRIFRAYDIRGKIDTQLNDDTFYRIGRAISCRLIALDRSRIFLGRDGRLSSENLAAALKQGLLDSGIDVIDLGAVTSPMLYFATATKGIDSGLMVTGSHNPADYNGIKIILAGTTLAQGEIDALYQLIESGVWQDGAGLSLHDDVTEDYIQRIISDIRLQRPFNIVVDCGNGIAGPVVVRVMRALGCEVTPLYCEVDGRFPNHHPDPSVEANLIDLKATVVALNADIGLAFDGDADRLGVVTATGQTILPDRLMMLFAQDILQRNHAASIVYDVKCSGHLGRVIEDFGGRAVMCPTGHSLVKRVMKTKQALLAGEMSGHLFFKERWYGFDDALYSACRLLEILSSSHESVDSQFKCIPNSHNTPEIKIPVTDDYKFEVMRRFCESAKFEGARVIKLDGIRAEYPWGWGLLRASNTTPNLVARFEAEDEAGLRRLIDIFQSQIKLIDAGLILGI